MTQSNIALNFRWPIYPLLAACIPLASSGLPSSAPAIYQLTSGGYVSGHLIYQPASAFNEIVQLRILERFAHELVVNTSSTPQGAIDAVNSRFWDLI
jgi:hypothetical protein